MFRWGGATLTVVYNDRKALDSLKGRMGKVSRVGALIHECSFDKFLRSYPEHGDLLRGWEKNLRESGAMLALGLSAL